MADISAILAVSAAPLLAVLLAVWVMRRETEGSLLIQIAIQGMGALAPAIVMIGLGQTASIACHTGALTTLCLAIARVDVRKFIIPDLLILGIAALAIAAPFRLPGMDQMIGAISMGAIFLGIRMAYAHLRRVEGLGLGDVKLAVVMGAHLGLEAALLATAFAAALTALWVAAPALLANGPDATRITLRTQAPLGVGLAAALALAGATMAIVG